MAPSLWSDTSPPPSPIAAHPHIPSSHSSIVNTWAPAEPSNDGGRPQIDWFDPGPHVIVTRERAFGLPILENPRWFASARWLPDPNRENGAALGQGHLTRLFSTKWAH